MKEISGKTLGISNRQTQDAAICTKDKIYGLIDSFTGKLEPVFLNKKVIDDMLHTGKNTNTVHYFH